MFKKWKTVGTGTLQEQVTDWESVFAAIGFGIILLGLYSCSIR